MPQKSLFAQTGQPQGIRACVHAETGLLVNSMLEAMLDSEHYTLAWQRLGENEQG